MAEITEPMDYTYHDGKRIFAYVGRSHCAAILPIKQEDGRVKYKIRDTWDSTTRYIGEWFVYKEPAPVVSAVTQSPNSAFECGKPVCRPQFGEGIIISATGFGDTRILEICIIHNTIENFLKKGMRLSPSLP